MDNDPYRFLVRLYVGLFEPLNRGLWSRGLEVGPPVEGASVLDLGCGAGGQLALCQARGCRAFGIDRSPAMLRVARQRLGAGSDLRVGDAASLPFADGSFDLVLATLVLHEMSPRVRAATLREARRVLRPKGRILVIDFHAGPPRRSARGLLNRAFILASELGAGREHFRNYRSFIAAGGIPGLAAAGGLTVERRRLAAGGNVGIYLLAGASAAAR